MLDNVAAKCWANGFGVDLMRIGFLAEVLSPFMGKPVPYTELLRKAEPIHDFGKIGIPDTVLEKPGLSRCRYGNESDPTGGANSPENRASLYFLWRPRFRSCTTKTVTSVIFPIFCGNAIPGRSGLLCDG